MEVTKYESGMFCWMELATNDQKASRRFYEGLFGWTQVEFPMPDGVYVTLQKNGKDAAALYENKQVPPNWLSYIAVDSADETVARAKALGANLINGPFDVMDLGRMAVLADPEGAVFAIWQAKQHIGARVFAEPGAPCWNELETRDRDRAMQFYASLFGYRTEVSDMYIELHVGDRGVGGIMQMGDQMQGVPPHWMPYFWVEDVNAGTQKAESLGGHAIVPPMDIPSVGRFSVIRDPQGATFALFFGTM